MQAVADLHLLQVAQMRIERAQRLGHRRVAVDVDVGIEALRPREREDVVGNGIGAFRVEIGGKRVFVDHGFKPREIVVQLGARERRRQVIDDDRSSCAAWPGCLRRDR